MSARETAELLLQVGRLVQAKGYDGELSPAQWMALRLCVPKTKSERIDDEVRPRWRANLWRRIAEWDERPAHPFAKTDAF